MLSSTDWLRWTLLGALGAPLVACGGTAEDSGSGGDGGTSSGGSSTGGGSPTGGASSGGQGSGGASTESHACTNPQSLPGGFVRCDEGYTHRTEKGECSTERRTERIYEAPDDCLNCCEYDADCVEPNQFCMVSAQPEFGGARSSCVTGCVTDADCDSGRICSCGEFLGVCVLADCAEDGDCAGEMRCSSWRKDDGCGNNDNFTCQAPGDECLSALDCEGDDECRPKDGARECQPREYNCVIGRPFLVAGEIRTAPVGARSDWISPTRVSAEGLDAETRAALAAHWERAGQMEHASVAAFARFSLQLLALGAPAGLVEATTAALADETRHARLCFGVASVYRGREVGPLALSIDGALGGDLESIVRTAIEEGCVGETVAALEAARSAEGATDAVVRELLETIAEDEARHAELAYRFVAWALERHPELLPVVEDEFERALRGAMSVDNAGATSVDNARGALESKERDLTRYGVSSAEVQRATRRQALREIVEPCWRQFARRESPETAPEGRGQGHAARSEAYA